MKSMQRVNTGDLWLCGTGPYHAIVDANRRWMRPRCGDWRTLSSVVSAEWRPTDGPLPAGAQQCAACLTLLRMS